ncbi:GNAT family N-acetyltransferase [Sphingobacterium hungaricum]|uniref:GNAT family N-acetyltransferase n=1 Tax=Sphingobacterium hungaricum TaxID=2082723 RepID=UPI0018C9661C|nr:GNAT family N-acetyltransferase [Sphingobacterium hungaricum]
MISLVKTDSSDRDFRSLVKELDSDLKIRDGDEHDFYHQFNKIDALKQVLVAYENETAVGCGAIKEFSKDAMEVKRMYVLPYQRGKGIASKILAGLENWASELGYASCVLETGKKQPEAIALYKKSGYRIIPNYGQYIGIENSICFEKTV